MLRKPRLVTAAAVVAAVVLGGAGAARADAPWLYRGIVLPRGEVALDLGLGVAHAPSPDGDLTGWGLNLGLSVGIAPNLELGVRTGFRLDDDGRALKADNFGRPFDTETYGTYNDNVANPELHLTWAVARGPAAEVGLEVAGYLPVEDGSSFGMMFAVPIILRAGILRIDTGVYVPIIFSDQTRTTVSVPIQLWIQATRTLWLGPVFGLRVVNDRGTHDAYPLGFGLGSSLSRDVDLRAWFLFPDVSQDSDDRELGGGFALQVRFG